MKILLSSAITSSSRTLILAALTTLIASGCATQFNDYEGASNRAAVARICQQQGFITSDDFAHYSALQMGWGPRQNWTIVDDNKLQTMYLQKVEQYSRWKPNSSAEVERFKLQCADISVVASRVRNAGATATQSVPAYTPPTTTNCMTTYGWTRCTTY